MATPKRRPSPTDLVKGTKPMRMNHPTKDGRPSRVIKAEQRLSARRDVFDNAKLHSGYHRPGSTNK